MTRPGTVVLVRETPPSRSAPSDIDTWFIVGPAQKGPNDRAVRIRSLAEYIRVYGAKVSYSLLYDSLDSYFHEGGNRAYVARVSGPAAAVATRTLSDVTPVTTLRVDANSKGVWGNSVTVAINQGAVSGTRNIVVSTAAGVQETSPFFATKAEMVSWAANSAWIRLVDLGTGVMPAASSASLAGGADDYVSITDAHRVTALNALFPYSLGPGQVSVPGITTSTIHTALLAHAALNNRFAYLDAPDTLVAGTLTAAAAAARTAPLDARHGSMFWPWALIPGTIPGTTRTVPYSAVAAGITARNDTTYSPAQAPAGEWGRSHYSGGLSQVAQDDLTRQSLNEAGVNVAIMLNGEVKTYGARTVVDAANEFIWWDLGGSRLAMGIVANGMNIMERHLFEQFDGRKIALGHMGSELVGMMLEYYADGAVYGDTPQEAFAVDTTSDEINPVERLATGEVHAAISFRSSPMGELLILELIRRPITEAVN